MRPGVGEALIPFAIFSYFLFQRFPAILATTIIVGVIGYIVYYLHDEKQHWKRLGVPGPSPNFLFGNMLALRKGFHKMDTDWQNEYGNIIGAHLLGRPDLILNDLELAREVLVKGFPNFMDRPSVLPVDKDNDFSLFENALTVKEGDDWKLIRNHITPAFTTGKIKNMVPTFNVCSKIFCEVIGEYAARKEEFPLKERASRFTLDVISRTSFGLDANLQRNVDDPMMKCAMSMASLKRFEPALLLYALFPNMSQLYQRFTRRPLFRNDSHTFFKTLLSDLLERRMANKGNNNSVDFFQLLLNCMDDDEKCEEDKDIEHEEVKEVKNKRGLKQIEVLAQSFVFLLAGYETTATILQFVLYMLACFPEVQDKVRNEVNSIVDPENEDIGYEDISKMQYVEQVISETMRLYPPTARTSRLCTESTYLRDIKVDKGCSVTIPIWLIHYNEENYPNAQEFDPDRFSPEEKARRDPLAYLPFGYGPRNCIGMRFAQFELRMVLAHVIRKFQVTLPEGAPKHPLEVTTQGLTKSAEVLKVIFTEISH